MAGGGRIQHWKHGWIPISPQAKAYVAGRGPRPVTGTSTDPFGYDFDKADADRAERLARAKKRQAEFKPPPVPDDIPKITTNFIGDYRIQTLEGFPDITFSQPLNGPFADEATPERLYEVAQIARDFLGDFPGAKKNGGVIVQFGGVRAGAVATTDNDFPQMIKIEPDLWGSNTFARRYAISQLNEMRSSKWLVGADIDNSLSPDEQLAQFRRGILTHELGHVLHLRERRKEEVRRFLDNPDVRPMDIVVPKNTSIGEIDAFANELVTPRQMGLTQPGFSNLREETRQRFLDTPVPRWQVDSLDKKSAYAMTDIHDWFAEAFADGRLNGDKASESGKRALALARKLFGREK